MHRKKEITRKKIKLGKVKPILEEMNNQISKPLALTISRCAMLELDLLTDLRPDRKLMKMRPSISNLIFRDPNFLKSKLSTVTKNLKANHH